MRLRIQGVVSLSVAVVSCAFLATYPFAEVYPTSFLRLVAFICSVALAAFGYIQLLRSF